MKEYIVLLWDEAQSLQDKEGFDNNAYLIEDEKGLKDFGSGAYFVNKNWYFRNIPRTKELYLKLIDAMFDDADLSNPIQRCAAASYINITKALFLKKMEQGKTPKEAFENVITETVGRMAVSEHLKTK